MKIYRVYIPRMGVPYIDVRARSKAEAVAKAYSVTNTSNGAP